MEFFDDALNKTKEVFGVVSKKTEDAFNTGKVKYEITSLENKKSKDFASLGKIYFELLKDSEDISEEAKEIIDSIKEKNEKIEELNEFLKTFKSRVVCPKCGAVIEGNSVFCSACGEKL